MYGVGPSNRRCGPSQYERRTRAMVARCALAAPLVADRASWALPPADLLFVQRKISGTALLAARLKARVDVKALARPWLAATSAVGTET